MGIQVEQCQECDTQHFFCDVCSSRCCHHLGLLLGMGALPSIRFAVRREGKQAKAGDADTRHHDAEATI